MTITLDNAQVHDAECLPNCFTLSTEHLWSDTKCTWEISQYRDDRQALFQWFEWLRQTQTPMIGFNNESYDYTMLHFIFTNPTATYEQIYAKNQAFFESQAKGDNFAHSIWARDRFAPQIDLFKVHHFDNRAKTTSLKALQINMRSPTVVESKIPFGVPVSFHDVDAELIPYNKHDVKETKRFAHYSMGAIEFRLGLIEQFGVECLSWNDTKIGEKMLEQRLGDDVCYDRSSGRKERRQTPRYRIALADIIFPYVYFNNPEFKRVLDFMKAQVLTPDDLENPDAPIKTKGVFTDLCAHVGGLQFYFGTGGVHASVSAQRFQADENYALIDIDVEGLYPRISNVNRLAPEHLGEAFIAEYAKITTDRKQHAKGTLLNGTLKLANNGAWGKSNSKWSVFYDPKYAMTIPINGQLMICMLAEMLVDVPTLQLIQANTDGITYKVRRDYIPHCEAIEKAWQDYTQLVLEYAYYDRMFIRDVNNYIAVDTKGKLKQKGAYWHPDPLDYANSISTASPPCWHKDLSNIVSTRAAVAAMVYGVDPAAFIRCHTDPFDFMCRVKADRSSRLELGGVQIQNTTRYYVAVQGAELVKTSPPPAGCTIGAYKRRNNVSMSEYLAVMQQTGGQWDARVCTGKADKPDTWGTYQDRRTSIEAGWQIAECNDARSFAFSNVNYEFYINEARKLIIA